MIVPETHSSKFERRWWLLALILGSCAVALALGLNVVAQMASNPKFPTFAVLLSSALFLGFPVHFGIQRVFWWRTRLDACGVSQPSVIGVKRIAWEDVDGWRRGGDLLDLRHGALVLRIYLRQFKDPEAVVELVLAHLVAHNPNRWLSGDGGNARDAD